MVVQPPVPPACATLHAALPDRVAGAGRRPTRPDSLQTAAWGDPPIRLRCGVARPAALVATSEVAVFLPPGHTAAARDVAWLQQQRDGATVYTTANRAVFVEVTVPRSYGPQPAVPVALFAAVDRLPVLSTPLPSR